MPDQWQVPGRPQHPDFMKLADIVLALDARSLEDHETMEQLSAGVIDLESLVYMASQRCQRQLAHIGITDVRVLSAMGAAFLSAFITGALYERKYPPTAKGES